MLLVTFFASAHGLQSRWLELRSERVVRPRLVHSADLRSLFTIPFSAQRPLTIHYKFIIMAFGR